MRLTRLVRPKAESLGQCICRFMEEPNRNNPYQSPEVESKYSILHWLNHDVSTEHLNKWTSFIVFCFVHFPSLFFWIALILDRLPNPNNVYRPPIKEVATDLFDAQLQIYGVIVFCASIFGIGYWYYKYSRAQ